MPDFSGLVSGMFVPLGGSPYGSVRLAGGQGRLPVGMVLGQRADRLYVMSPPMDVNKDIPPECLASAVLAEETDTDGGDVSARAVIGYASLRREWMRHCPGVDDAEAKAKWVHLAARGIVVG